MFNVGQLIAMLVIGMLFGLIVKSQAVKNDQEALGNLGLGVCVTMSLVGGSIGFGWIPALVTMILFVVAINFLK
jgi:hypothetical protein